MLAGPPYGVGAGALLDVEVVGVERQPEVRPEQRPEGGQPLVDGVDQRGLVAVQRLDADHHVGRGGPLDHRREVRAELVVRRVPLVVGHPPGPAGRGVERPADPGGADRGGQLDARVQVVLGGRDGGRVGGDQVASGRHRADDVRREAGVADHLRGALGVEVAGLLEGELDGVEAERCDVAQEVGEVRVGERRGPDPGVDADGSHGDAFRGGGEGRAGRVTVSRHPAGPGTVRGSDAPARPPGSRGGPRHRTWRSARRACRRWPRGSRRAPPR